MKFYTFIMATAIMVLAATSATACDKDKWIWENCSQLYYRYACEYEDWGDCGWVYYNEEFGEEEWVTCEEFKTWKDCN